jgi:hypothetical protein
MARVGKARVLGSSAVIELKAGSNTCQVGEVDKFSAKQNSEVKKSQPLGVKVKTSQNVFQGWDLSFEGGKVDAKAGALFLAQERQFIGGGRSPYFEVVETVTFSDGTKQVYRYVDVTIHGFNADMNGSEDELSEKFEGFAAYREADPNSDAVTSAITVQSTAIAGLLTSMTSQLPDTATLIDRSGTKIGDSLKD